MNKKIIVAIVLAVLIIITIVLISTYNKPTETGDNMSNCLNLPEKAFGSQMDSVIKDCIGYAHIKEDTKCGDDNLITNTSCGDRSLYDAKNHKYIVDRIEDYRIADNSIFIAGDLSTQTTTYEDGRKITTFSFKENGEYKYVEFNKADDVPSYIVVDSQINEIKLYNDFLEMDENTKKQFAILRPNQ